MSATLDSNSETSEAIVEERATMSPPSPPPPPPPPPSSSLSPGSETLLPSLATVAVLMGEPMSEMTTLRVRSWSSGKRNRAPPPPPPPPLTSDIQVKPNCVDDYVSSVDSHEDEDDSDDDDDDNDDDDGDDDEEVIKRKKGFQEGWRDEISSWVSDERKRRQLLTCLVILLLLVLGILALTALIGRITKNFSDTQSTAPAKLSSRASVLLMMGGMAPGDDETSFLSLSPRNTLDELKWHERCRTRSKSPVTNLHGHTASVWPERSVIVCGGEIESRVSNRCFVHSLQDNTWTEAQTMITAVKFASAILINHVVTNRPSLVVSGGVNERMGALRRAQSLDLVSMTWSLDRRLSLDERRYGHCMVVSKVPGQGEVVVVVGGHTSSSSSSPIDVTRSVIGKRRGRRREAWRRIASLAQGRKHHGCLATIYKADEPVVIVAGGSNSLDTALTTVELISLSTINTVRRLGSLIRPRMASPVVALLNNRLVIAGGGEARIEVYVGSKNSFVLMKKRHNTGSPKAFSAAVTLPTSWVFDSKTHRNLCIAL